MTRGQITILLMLVALVDLSYAQTAAYYELRHFVMSNYENKHMDEVLSISSKVYALDSGAEDTTLVYEQVEYYDGEGNLAFSCIKDPESSEVRYWVKQLRRPDQQAFTIFTNLGRDGIFIIQSADESSSTVEFAQNVYSAELNLQVDEEMVRMQVDSIQLGYIFGDQGNITKVVHRLENGELAFESAIEILNVDDKGNWTNRILTNTSGGSVDTYLHQREIKYEDAYEAAKYFELKIDSLIIADEYIRNIRTLRPRFSGGKPDSLELRKQAQQERIFRFAENLYHRKYFNDDYFFDIIFSEKDELKILENRFYGPSRAQVTDLRKQRFYQGRTSSERWFDKTASYKRLQGLEAEPTPTDEWTEIDGYRCRAYVRKNARGRDEVFYVTEELPYVNYLEFTCVLPGFVMKSTRNIADWGEVTVVVDLEEAKYPFRFLEFMRELNGQFGTQIQYLHELGAEE